jgi:cytoskeletal protein RodZ
VTELGNRLKEARLAKGLSLDDLQSITKIQKRYLVGIEEGDYSTMPGNFYVRAFIKQYAEAVQLDPEEIFQTYKDEIPSTLNEDLPEQLSRVKTRKMLSDRSPKVFDLLPKFLIAIVVVGLAALVYYFLQHNAGTSANETESNQNAPVQYAKSKNLEQAKTSEDQTKKTNSKEQSTKQTKPETQAPAQVQAPQQSIAPTQSAGRNSTYQVTNADKFVVKVASRGNTWINIKNSKGVSQFQGILKAGDSKEVDLSTDTQAVVTAGNSIDTDIFVNDQKIDYAVPPTQQVRQDITIQYVPKTQ